MRCSSDNADHFDLLPFIAIMMCILGCLFLVTVSMASVSMGLGAGETWVPGGKSDATGKQPVLFEWDGKTATVHRDNQVIHIDWQKPPTQQVSFNGQTLEIADDDHDPNTALKEEIHRIAQHRDTQYALIAVRPSGFANFFSFAHAFRHQDVTIGYEPIGQDKPVKLQVPTSAKSPGQ